MRNTGASGKVWANADEFGHQEADMGAGRWRTVVARLMMLGAVVCGVLGLIIGVVDREWRLGVTGWFTGGTLLAVLAIVMLADEYVEYRRRRSEQ